MTGSDFSAFQRLFKGELVTPSDPDYAASIARWAINAERRAKIVAFVKDEEDVALALKYARENMLPLAVRGGGHSSSGASSSENGLVIDLSRHLNGVRIDAENKLAYVGGGAIWESVDKAAIEHGLAAVAGSVNHTGVGGLTLGGGFGWLTPAHGLVIDNIVQVTLVTAAGTKLVASQQENPDLFWGVRGTGGNFGVVTEFIFKLHPQRRTVFAGQLIFPPPALEAVIAHTSKWWEDGPSDKEGMFQMLARGPDRSPCVLLIVFYNGSEEEGRANFKALYDLNPVADLTREMPYEELNGISSVVLGPGVSNYLKGTALIKARYEPTQQCFTRLLELSEGPEFDIFIGFEYLPLTKVMQAGPDATAYVRRGYPNVINIIRWKDNTPENLEIARTIGQELIGIIAKSNIGAGAAVNLGYGNYDAEGHLPEDVEGFPYSGKAHLLYGEHYPKLQALKKQYDPDVVFSNFFVITPA